MPEVLSLIDKKVATIFTPYDFEELVDKYMGWEARQYIHRLLEELAAYEENTDEETVEALKEKVSELENELEILRDEYNALEEEYGH